MTARREQLEARTAEELRRQAREAGHTGVGRLRKAELIEWLLAADEPSALVEPEPARVGRPRGRLGALVSAAGGLGLILSLALLVAGPLFSIRLGQWAEVQMHSMADRARALAVTSRSSRSALSAGAVSLYDARDTLLTVEASLGNLDPLLSSTRVLLGDELPSTIDATEAALLSAQQGAAAMDRVLRGLSLFGLDYDPELPLDQSLAATAEGLAPLPDSLQAVEKELRTSQQDLAGVSTDLSTVGADLGDLADDLDRTAKSLTGYAGQLESGADQLEALEGRAWLGGRLLALATAVVALWLAMVNVVLMVNGRWMRTGLDFGPK
ncbi:MAG: hypothetical protein WBR18_00465 [Anaerolineales bacterium]